MKRATNWKLFLCELVLSAFVAIAYFVFVLHYLGHWLKDIFDHHRLLFAVVALALMVGQAVGLEIVSGLILWLIRRERR